MVLNSIYVAQWFNYVTAEVSLDVPSGPKYVGFVHFGFMGISMDAFSEEAYGSEQRLQIRQIRATDY